MSLLLNENCLTELFLWLPSSFDFGRMAQVGKRFHRMSKKRCVGAYWARRVLEAKYARKMAKPTEIGFVPVKGLRKGYELVVGLGVTETSAVYELLYDEQEFAFRVRDQAGTIINTFPAKETGIRSSCEGYRAFAQGPNNTMYMPCYLPKTAHNPGPSSLGFYAITGWNSKGEMVRCVGKEGQCRGLADLDALAVSSNGTMHVVAGHGSHLYQYGLDDSLTRVVELPEGVGDNPLIAASADGTVYITADTVIHIINPDGELIAPLKGHSSCISSLVFDSATAMLFSSSFGDTIIKVWASATRELTRTLRSPLSGHGIRDISLGPNGNIYALTEGIERDAGTVHEGMILTGSLCEGQTQTLCVWDAHGELLHTINNGLAPRTLFGSLCHLVVAQDNTIYTRTGDDTLPLGTGDVLRIW